MQKDLSGIIDVWLVVYGPSQLLARVDRCGKLLARGGSWWLVVGRGGLWWLVCQLYTLRKVGYLIEVKLMEN